MSEDFITFETAQLAKEKGFDLNCDNFFTAKGESKFAKYYDVTPNNNLSVNEWLSEGKFFCTRPTQSLLQKWLREKHNLDLDCATTFSRKYSFMIYKGMKPAPDETTDDFDTYEAALEEALQKALTLI